MGVPHCNCVVSKSVSKHLALRDDVNKIGFSSDITASPFVAACQTSASYAGTPAAAATFAYDRKL